jgi:DNA repair protein RadD
MQGIVFGVDRQHSREIAEAFNAAGISAVHLDGAIRPRTQARRLSAFRAGETRSCATVELFGEGFRRPSASHTLASLGLRRASRCTFNSAAGLCVCFRASRTPSSATMRAMRCACPRFPTTTGNGRSKDASAARGRANGPSDALPIRQCLDCYMVSPSSADHCPGCGVVFPGRPRPACHEEGELFELTRLNAKKSGGEQRQRKAEERACGQRSLEDWMRLGKARG